MFRSSVYVGFVALGLAAFACTVNAQSRSSDSILRGGFDSPDAGPYADADAARFLAQATFGPTKADIDYLRSVGYNGWLNEQLDPTKARPTHAMDYLHWVKSDPANTDNTQVRMESWFLGALGGPDPSDPTNPSLNHIDQLRQRVAFALSQIFVTSDAFNFTIQGNPAPLAAYYDILVDDAFGNYRKLLEDVTLSPAMGSYLSMLGNRKPDAVLNIRPDENYAREIMQLFSVGLVQLNIDGTPILANGQPVPTYTQLTVKGFAHAFTGWSYFGCQGKYFVNPNCAMIDKNNESQWTQPMEPVEESSFYYYDIGSSDTSATPDGKQLLDYSGVALSSGILPAYSTEAPGLAASDLELALDNIFYHPNVGPFVSKQLIQRLVTSNPTPAYVARIARIFNNDGSAQHTRGNLKAVVTAILLDPEARSGQWVDAGGYGKLREPMLRLTHLWRVMHAAQECGTDEFNNPFRYTELHPEPYLAQAPLRAPSVFNFYLPDFSPAGEMAQAGKLAPEMQITTDSTMTSLTNAFQGKIYFNVKGGQCYGGPHSVGFVRIDPTVDVNRANNVQSLVDYYDLVFMSGQMSPYLRTNLTAYLNTLPNTSAGFLQRVQDALFLILTSPEYVVQQ